MKAIVPTSKIVMSCLDCPHAEKYVERNSTELYCPILYQKINIVNNSDFTFLKACPFTQDKLDNSEGISKISLYIPSSEYITTRNVFVLEKINEIIEKVNELERRMNEHDFRNTAIRND